MQKWSLSLGRVAGIRIAMHWTFLILVVWIFIAYYRSTQDVAHAVTGVLFVLALFTCVLLHELGHSLMARRFDIRTDNIMLLPIGGVASLERMPEKPAQELLIAIAGPLVNVVIAIAIYAFLMIANSMPTVEGIYAMNSGMDVSTSGNQFLFNLMLVNVILVIFNLIPAFPMDGGRVLRAALAFGMDRHKATAIAARTGQFIAIIFVVVGLFTNFWLIFIGLFVFLGASAEETEEKSKFLLAGCKVGDAIMKNYTVLSPSDSLAQAAKALLNSQESSFIVADGENIKGVLTRKALVDGLSSLGKDAPVSNALQEEVVLLHPEMDLTEAYTLLRKKGGTLGPVVSDGTIIGVLDTTNITELIMINKALKARG